MEKWLKGFLKDGVFGDVSEHNSRIMAAIRGKNNRTTEVRLRMALIRAGIKGWKLHAKELPGHPDFYFSREKVAIFVDGCYWHGCPKCGHIPKTRSKFWEAKIKRNRARDKIKRMELRKIGISTVRIWEHELKDNRNLGRVIEKIDKLIRQE